MLKAVQPQPKMREDPTRLTRDVDLDQRHYNTFNKSSAKDPSHTNSFGKAANPKDKTYVKVIKRIGMQPCDFVKVCYRTKVLGAHRKRLVHNSQGLPQVRHKVDFGIPPLRKFHTPDLLDATNKFLGELLSLRENANV